MLMILLSTLSVIMHLICGNNQNVCHVWASAPTCFLDFLDKLQKGIGRSIGPSPAVQSQPSVFSLGITLLDIHLNWLSRFHILTLEGSLLVILIRLHDFSVTIPRCYKDVYVNSFFPLTTTLWNSLPIECFPLTIDLSGFNSRIYRHLLTVGSF